VRIRVGHLGTSTSYRSRNVLIAAALAIGALVLVTLYVKKSDNGSAAPATLVASVLVARHDIPVGTPGAALGDKIRLEKVPQAEVVPGAISSRAQVIPLVTAENIYAGEQVSARRFQTLGAEGIKGQIAHTYRALQVAGDGNQLLAGTLAAGDHVDVLANIKFSPGDFRDLPTGQGEQEGRVATRIVLRDIRVLQVSGAAAAAGGLSSSTNSSSWVMFAFTDIQAQKMFFVMKNADWWLELRPAHGDSDSSPSVDTAGSVIGDGLGTAQFNQLLFGARSP
jgi:Flp pilus assembly protein CpaB